MKIAKCFSDVLSAKGHAETLNFEQPPSQGRWTVIECRDLHGKFYTVKLVYGK